MNLFMDDCPSRAGWAAENIDDVALTFDARSTINALGKTAWDTVYLDHDLVGVYQDTREKNCGSEVVRWIVANKPSVGRFVVHSMNVPAANNMVAALRDAGYDAHYVSFLKLIDNPEAT